MEFRQLRYLVAIIDYGSMSRASMQLNVAQPAISVQISNLEKELGVTLFNRNARGIVPTAACMTLYRRARGVLGEVGRIRQSLSAVDDAEQVKGPLRVGFPSSIDAGFGMPFSEQIHRNYPGIMLHLTGGRPYHIMELLLRHQIDLAVLSLEKDHVGLYREPLMEEDFFLVTRDGSEGEAPVELRALVGRKFVLPSAMNQIRTVIDAACDAAGIQLDVVMDMDSLSNMIDIAAAGWADIILPFAAICRLDPARDLYLRPVIRPELKRVLSLCRVNETPESMAVLAGEETIRNVVRSMCADGPVMHGRRLL